MNATTVTIGTVTRPAAEVDIAGRRAATGFASLGLGQGDTVALAMRNDFPFLEATLGAGRLGAYTTPINWHFTAAEAEHLLVDSEAKVLVAHTDIYDRIAHVVPPQVRVFTVLPSADLIADYALDKAASRTADDWTTWLAQFEPSEAAPLAAPGAMVYTSGTTGRPKGVRRDAPTPQQVKSSLNMFLTLTGMHDWLADPASATALIPGPTYHATPNVWLSALYGIGANVVVETKFEPERLLASVERHRVTHLVIVPTMAVRLLRLDPDVRARYDLSSLKFVMHGAAPCPVAVKRALIDWLGPIVHEHYGGTELGAVTYCDTPQWLAHPGTVGAPIAGVKLVVIDEAGREVSHGVTGEIYCRNFDFPDFTYNNDPGKRERAGRDGLVSLGDVGYLDADGFLYLCGRSSEMINSGGVNIYPAEIEAELLKFPPVADCGVIGIPDEEFGETVCAHVQLREGFAATPDDIRGFLRDRLAGYKIPRRIEIDAELPREDSGKIFKAKLKRLHERR